MTTCSIWCFGKATITYPSRADCSQLTPITEHTANRSEGSPNICSTGFRGLSCISIWPECSSAGACMTGSNEHTYVHTCNSRSWCYGNVHRLGFVFAFEPLALSVVILPVKRARHKLGVLCACVELPCLRVLPDKHSTEKGLLLCCSVLAPSYMHTPLALRQVAPIQAHVLPNSSRVTALALRDLVSWQPSTHFPL